MNIEKGTYEGQVSKWQLGMSSQGNEQIILTVNLPSEERTVDVYLSFSEKAMPYSVKKLRACGWRDDDATKLIGVQDNKIQVAIHYEIFNGREMMKADILTGPKVEPMDASKAKGFGARVSAFLGATGQRSLPSPKAQHRTTQAQATNGYPAASDDDSEIPF